MYLFMYLKGPTRIQIMSSANWIRYIEVVFDSKSVKLSDFDVEFTHAFNLDEEPNECEIYIKNLSKNTINSYIRKDKRLIINAGYQGNFGTVFNGYIADTDTGWSGTDKDTQIIGFDATEQYLNAFISKTYVPGTLASVIINDVLKGMGLTIGEITLTKDVQYTIGRSINGKRRDVLKDIVVNDCNTNLQIINGAVYIRAIKQGLETGFVLTPQTGLIGSPEPVEDVNNEEKEKTADYRVTCQLNYRIKPMVRLKIKSSTFTGDCVVISGEHRASKKGDFVTDMEVKVI